MAMNIGSAERAAINSSIEPEGAIVLEIRVDRTLRINSQPIEQAALRNCLVGIFERRANGLLFLRGAGGLEFGTVASILDVARSAGVDHIALDTAAKTAPMPF